MQDKVVNHDVKLDNWEIKHLYKDILWVKMLDEPVADFVAKNGIFLKTEQANRGYYRIGEVLLCGEDTKWAKPGEKILIPPQTGIMGFKNKDGFKTVFIDESRVMAVITFTGTPEALAEHITDLHLNA